MANEPSRWMVRASPALLEHVRGLYGPERGADGTPSYDDFVAFMLPRLTEAVSVTWSSAQPVPDFDGLVRELVTRPHMMFGPARVTGFDDGETVWLIGYVPDEHFWAVQEDHDD